MATVSPARIFGRPAPAQVWLGPRQGRALSFTSEALASHDTALLLGPRACGKSTILDTMLQDLPDAMFFRLRDRWESGVSLRSALMESVGLSPAGASESGDRELLGAHLLAQRQAGRTVVFAIDDAERLPKDAWRELFRLRAVSLGSDAYFLFVGRAETHDALRSAGAGGWPSLKVVVHTMASPTEDEISAYVLHRLHMAGISPALFPSRARAQVARRSKGSFARVNLLCQVAILLAQRRSLPRIDATLVEQASRMLSRGSLHRKPATLQNTARGQSAVT